MNLEKEFALARDSHDPLASFKNRFYIPPAAVYLDGNSLGLMSVDSEKSIIRAMKEWKTRAINGWLEGEPPWFYLAEETGSMAHTLVGAKKEELICTGTTTVKLHALLSTFYKPLKNRKKILADELNFPSDIYALKGHIKLRGLNIPEDLILVAAKNGFLEEKEIVRLMTPEVALIILPSVLYKSGQLLDMAYLTKEAHERGIIIGFDCCHSVGIIPHEFDEWGIDFAFWCSYKYLNAGPGSPAFLYINRKHFPLEPLLAGWFGYLKHKQFDMLLDFKHAQNAGGWQISTPPILGLASVKGALSVILEAGIKNIRKKSIQLTEYFINLVDQLLPSGKFGIKIGSPRNAQQRSGHVALIGKDNFYQVFSALKARGFMPDFRPPNIIRFAPIALYNTYLDVWRTVNTLKEIIDKLEYLKFPQKRLEIT